MDTEFVTVPVPRELVTEVMRFIAERSDHKPVAPGTAEAAVDEAAIEWSVADLARLRQTNMKTTRTVSALLDVLASDPENWFTTTQLEARTGIDRREIKGALSALTRHVRKHYSRANWPMTYEWGGRMAGPAPLEGHYQVSAVTADRWHASA